jgi:hypothetical protein
MSRAYFRLLAEHGLLRDDLDVEAIAYAFQATFEGFLQAEAAWPRPIAPTSASPKPDRAA